MFYKVDRHSSNFLLSQPESGMGYQTVEATLSNNGKKYCVVFNAEVIVSVEELELVKKYGSYNNFRIEAQPREEIIKDLKVIEKLLWLKLVYSTGFKGELRPSTGVSKEENPVQKAQTRKQEIFKRFSAYINDRRITENHGLLPGTYATTENDTKVVPSGLAAVARYALPNPFPAVRVFAIKPPENTAILCGTVIPAFNQSGGGVEVLFTNRCPANTVDLPPNLIPER